LAEAPWNPAATLLWSGLALVVFVPLAVRMYASKQR
jgi:hypothetical protein